MHRVRPDIGGRGRCPGVPPILPRWFRPASAAAGRPRSRRSSPGCSTPATPPARRWSTRPPGRRRPSGPGCRTARHRPAPSRRPRRPRRAPPARRAATGRCRRPLASWRSSTPGCPTPDGCSPTSPRSGPRAARSTCGCWTSTPTRSQRSAARWPTRPRRTRPSTCSATAIRASSGWAGRRWTWRRCGRARARSPRGPLG